MVIGKLQSAALTAVVIVLGCQEEPSTPLPCDVDRVFEAKCRECHGADPDFGAPMSLVWWEQTQRRAPTLNQPVWEVIRDRVRDVADPMPPAGLEPLTEDELAILDAWFAAEAPPGEPDQSCR